MNLTLISNVNELTANEQKTLYTEGADIYTGIYYLITEADQFSQMGKDVVPNTPALRALSSAAGISWILTHFRGKKVAFGSVSS